MMPVINLSARLINTLQRAVDRLDNDAILRIRQFVVSQRTDSASFVNRGGREDLYYTLFGWILSIVLNIDSDERQREKFLRQINMEDLDEFHQVVFRQAREVHVLMKHGFIGYGVRWLMRGKTDFIQDFFRSYVGQSVSDDAVNAVSAQLVLDGMIDGFKSKSAVSKQIERLKSMQQPNGGWTQSAEIMLPDILSTAVALFTLRQFGVEPQYQSLDFIDAHWQEDGSFAPNLLDTESDTEYMFYGLLALGSISSTNGQ